MKKVIVIGRGPAGISAALYTARAGLDTLIVAKDGGAIERAVTIENYYGFAEPISGKELSKAASLGAKRLGVGFVEGEVTALEIVEGGYAVRANGKEYFANGVVIATGARRRTPKIPGMQEFLGRGVSYCAVCDSFAARGRDAAVIGAGEYAVSEALTLLGVSRSVTLCTNGEAPPAGIPEGIAVRTEPIAAIEGEETVTALRFFSGETLRVGMVFSAIGVAGGATLAERLGIPTEDGRLRVDERGATPLPGLYAAGDCTGGFLQIATAVAEGARAGAELAAELKRQWSTGG